MREIEFRAWHKEATKMLYEDYTGDALRWKREGQPIVVMQYTGLKDKNGVKIFEGDILSTDCDGNSFFYVIFFEGSYCLEYNGNTQGRNPLSEKRSQGLVVVGNIYENPELMEGDK